MPTKIQLRRDTAADWTSNNPTLAAGEFGWESDTNKFKIGDGTTAWTSLGYASAEDAAGITFVGDDSTGTLISDGETIKIAGTQNITTAVSGDTLTITGPDLSSYITNSPITVVGDDSTGTVFNTGETVKIAGAGSVTTAVSGDTLTITGAGGDVVDDTTPQLGGDLDINSNDITGTGNISITGNISTDAISLADNKIATTRSNDDLFIDASGTGHIFLGDGKLSQYDHENTSGRADRGVTRTHYVEIDASTQTASSHRYYANTDFTGFKLTGSSTNSNARWQRHNLLQVDLNGTTHTAAGGVFNSSGERHLQSAYLINSSSTAGSLGNMNAGQFAINIKPTVGDITVTDAVANNAVTDLNLGGSGTTTVTNFYNYKTSGSIGSNTTLTNSYGLYLVDWSGEAGTITNDYGVYAANDNQLSRLGGITLQSGDIETAAIKIEDNKIRTHRSNDDLLLATSGTGMIVSGGQASDLEPNERYGHARYYYEEVDPTTMTTTDSQRRALHDEASYKISASSANSNARFRKTQAVAMDMAGFDLTATSAQYLSRGPQNGVFLGVDNTSGSSASTLANAQGIQAGIELYNTGGQGLTVNSAVGNSTYINVRSGITMDNGYGYRTFLDNSGTVTNWYAYYAENLDQATNNYAFYTANAAHLSRMGAVILANQTGDPAGVIDSSHIYAKDDAGSSEVYVRDEAGNVTKISPHNDAGEWEYYSVNKNTGKTVRVNMEKMIRKLEQLTGETFIENQ